jgi:hypothetical protein
MGYRTFLRLPATAVADNTDHVPCGRVGHDERGDRPAVYDPRPAPDGHPGTTRRDAGRGPNGWRGLPVINVTSRQKEPLQLPAVGHGSLSILAAATLVGYGTIGLPRALPADKRLVIVEANSKPADGTKPNGAALADLVELRVDLAFHALLELTVAGDRPVAISRDRRGQGEQRGLLCGSTQVQ